MTNIYTPKQQRILLITSLLVIGGFIIVGLRGYVSAFFGAIIFYVIFKKSFYGLVYKRKWNRQWVTMGIIVFSLLTVIIPFLMLSLLLLDRIQFYSLHIDQIMVLTKKAEELSGFKFTSQQSIRQMLQQGAGFASSLLPSVAGGALDFLLIIGLMLFSLYFMFADEETFQLGLRRYLPFKRDTLKELGAELRKNVNANVLGQVLVSMSQGFLTGLTLFIFHVPDPVFWGTVTFFFSFVPVLGTPFVWVPAALIKLSQGETTDGIGILIMGFVIVVNIDNVLRIFLAKRMGNVHPLVTLMGVVFGVPLFGILGLVIGPTLISFFMILIRVFERENDEQREDVSHDDGLFDEDDLD